MYLYLIFFFIFRYGFQAAVRGPQPHSLQPLSPPGPLISGGGGGREVQHAEQQQEGQEDPQGQEGTPWNPSQAPEAPEAQEGAPWQGGG